MQTNLFRTQSLDDARIGRVLSAALDAVHPGRLVAKYLDKHPLPPHKRLFILGIGKAAESMARAAASRTGFPERWRSPSTLGNRHWPRSGKIPPIGPMERLEPGSAFWRQATLCRMTAAWPLARR